MFPEFSSDGAEEVVEAPACSASCPVCGGLLTERRGESRCLRCQFVVCQGCDGECPAVEGDAAGW
jgi:hypothetical protein